MTPSTSRPASTGRPLILSLSLICLFSLMLLGTSKREEETPPEEQQQPAKEQQQPSEAEQEGAEPGQGATIPPSDDWKRVELPEVGVALRLPPGAEIDHTRSGVDESYAGRYFHVLMASGNDVYVSDNVGHNPIDIADKAEFYRDRADGFDGYFYRSDDALVARRSDAEPAVGSYCETTACVEAGEEGMCVRSAGATIEGEALTDLSEEDVSKLSDQECLQVVAMVRSIEALK